MRYDLAIIDASGWLHRAFHAFPPLSRQDGFPTGAIVGCMQTLFWQITEGVLRDVTHAVAVFDLGGPTFRHALSPAYKADRKRKDDLYPQIAAVRRGFEAFGVATFGVPNVEADDIIASLVTGLVDGDELGDFGIAILSSDKDLAQLVGPTVHMVESMGQNRGRVRDEQGVIEKWGVPPSKMGAFLALVGDNADGVKGINGIGEKGAAKILKDFDGVEDLLTNVERLPELKHRLLLDLRHHDVRDAYQLVRLPSPDCPEFAVPDIGALLFKPDEIDVARVLAFFDENEIVTVREEVEKRWLADAPA